MDYNNNWDEKIINLMPVMKSMFQPNPITYMIRLKLKRWIILSLNFFSPFIFFSRIVFNCVRACADFLLYVLICWRLKTYYYQQWIWIWRIKSMICYGLEINTNPMRWFFFLLLLNNGQFQTWLIYEALAEENQNL